MKKIITLALTGLALLLTSTTFAQVGFGTNQPDKSAAVDIVSSKRGLLIPRIDIPNLNNAAPVTSPATSLFVYNENTTTGVGFYFWDGSKWVKFVSGNNEKSVSVSAGKNVDVTATTTGNNDTDYEVSIAPSGTDGDVLVTEDDGAGGFTTTWVDPQTFIEDVTASNGLTFDATTSTVELGGDLDQATEITTNSANTLAITGLTDVVTPSTEKVMIMNGSGVLQTTDISDLVNANAKDLTTGTALEITGTGAGAVLQAVEIGIADQGIKAVKLSSADGGGVNAAAGTVATADGSGNVTYKALTADQLTNTANVTLETALEFTNTTDGVGAVLKAFQIGIEDQGVTTAKIKDQSVTTDKIAPSATFDQVLTTDAAGLVTWTDNNTVSLANGTNTTVSSKTPAGTNNTEWKVNVATATGTTLGVVKQAATPTVDINASGELFVNLTNTVLDGEVTGPLNATKIKPGATLGTILTTTDDGSGMATSWETPNSLLKVGNGLHKDATTNEMHLGGELDEATIITTDATDAANLKTLAIKGLQAATTASSIVVVDNTSGVLSTIKRSIVKTTNTSLTINSTDISGYSGQVLKLTVLADITNSDVNITLPTASADNKGQVINIKVDKTSSDLTTDFYVNIKDNAGAVITYGSLPYQGWTLTSTGSAWVITGRY